MNLKSLKDLPRISSRAGRRDVDELLPAYLGILQRDLRVCTNRKIEQPICSANYNIVIFSSVKSVLQLFICCLILISTKIIIPITLTTDKMFNSKTCVQNTALTLTLQSRMQVYISIQCSAVGSSKNKIFISNKVYNYWVE